MNTPITPRTPCRTRPAYRRFAVGLLRALWTLIRLPVLAVLLALEPVASFILTTMGILGIAATLFLKLSGVLPRFPFWTLLAMSVGALLALTTYRILIGMLAR